MMLEKNEFIELFKRKSRELVGQMPRSSDVERAYNGYKTVVKIHEQDASFEFFVASNGKLGVHYGFDVDNKPTSTKPSI